MDEKYINDLYSQLGGRSVFGEFSDFKSLIMTDDDYASDVYNQMGGKSVFGEYVDFRNLTKSSPAEQLKKNESSTESPSAVGSSALSVSADPEALRFAELLKKQEDSKKTLIDFSNNQTEDKDLSGLDVNVQDEKILTKQPREERPLVLRESTKVVSPRAPQRDVATDQIDERLNKIQEERLINLDLEFENKKEVDFFEGGIGTALREFDKYSPVPLGEIIDDTARTLASGYAQGQLASAANDLMVSGSIPSEETIASLIEYDKMVREIGPSDAFINYQKKSKQVGGGFFGFFRGVSDNPSVLPELIANSFSAMATNKEAVLAGVGAILTNAIATAAAAGTPTAGVGAAPGFVAGAVSALPVAMGLASGIITTGATFAELLQAELGVDELGNPIEFNQENVKAVLENPEKLNRIRNKAILKGGSVGAIDFVTAKAASSVGAKILSKSAAQSTTGAATKEAVTKSVAAGSVVESGGGSLGEFVGTGLAGEKQSLENILFEGITEMPMSLVSTAQARFAKPVYKVNKKNVTAEQLDEIINTMEPADLAVAKIEIKNDFEGRNKRMQDKIVTGAIADEVRAAQPNINEPTVNAIVELQKQLNTLEGNKTQVAKDRAVQIKADIKNLQENPLTKPTEQDAIQVPVQEVKTPKILIESLETGDLRYARVDDNGDEIGMLTSSAVDDKIIIDNIFVDEDSKRKGVATSLIDRVIEEYKGKSYEATDEQGNDIIKPYQIEFGTIVSEEGDAFVTSIKEKIDLFNAEQTKSKPQVVAQEGKAQEVESKPIVIGDKVLDNDGVEYEVVDLVTSRKGTQQAEVRIPKRTDSQIQEDARRNVFGRNENRLLYKDSNDPKFIKEQSIAISQETSDLTAVNNSSQGSTTLDLVDLKKAEPQAQTVETLRAQEQAELTEALTDAEQYMVDGKIDGEKITDPAEKKIFDDIYDKYDKLITPLIEAKATPDPERIATLPIDQVSQDPARFQYKSDVDPETGVSEKLKSRKFQRSLAGVISVWVDPNDGKTYVINGHHRLDLAKSTGQKNIDVRYIQSDNAEQARVIGAMQNIAESQGTDVDAAKIFRSGNMSVQQLKDTGLSMTDSKVRKGFALSNLSDGLFNLVVSGDLDVNKAVIIGENIPSKDVQEQFFKMIKGKNLTNSTIQVMAQDIQAAPKKKEIVADLFGTTTTEIADYEKRASLVAGIRDVISRAKNLLGKAARGKDFLEEYGNQIDRARSEGVSKEAAEAIAVFDKLRNTSPEISTIIKESFEKLQAGETKSTIINEAAKRIIAITPQILGRRDAKNDKARSEVSGVEQAKEAAEVEGKLDELLKLDPKEKGAGQKALDYLDGLIKDYDDIQSDGLGVNIALPAIKAIIKSIRALVQAGVNLNDAIKRIAKENNFSVKDVVSGINAVSQILPIQKEFDALMIKADALINTQKSKDITEKKIVSNLDTMVRNFYKDMDVNDAQRKIMEREARARMGVEPRKAASIGRVIGVLKDITNVSRKEKLQIISRIRELGRDVAKDLTAEIRALNKTGKISLTQATNIISRLGEVNMLNEKSVVNFIGYMTKVFANANYNASLIQAKGLRKSIKRLSKNKEKNANLRDLSQKFAKIDPSLVDDINAYNDVAAKIKTATEGSSIRKSEVNFAQTVNIENATQYIDKAIKDQKELILQQKADEIQDLMDVDVSDLSYEDMMMMLDPKVEITKYNEGIIRGLVKKAFDSYSSIIKKTLKTGKDPFTGEDVSFTDSQRDVITRFMGMDLSLLKPREALQAVDALANFFENKSTAKMEAVISYYTGSIGPKKLLDRGIIAQKLKKYWSPKLARLLGEQATNQNILFERMFKGFTKAGLVEDAMGVTDLKNGKSLATSQSNTIVERYVDQFYKKEANGQAFNTEYNSVERGLAAFMTRNVIGSEAAMQTEFNRRKRLVKESIKVLSEGNDKEKIKSKIYQEAYDKLVAAKEGAREESSSINDVKNRVDKTNLEAVEWWNNEWSDKFDELSDVSLNVYNKVLDKDLNYTPDKYSNLSQETGTVELSNDDSAFHNNSGAIYKKETGVLMEATKPGALPRNEKSGEVSRYIDLSFDQNNSNAMYDALVDIKTAGPIRQIEGFLNSPDFKKIVPTSEDARILKDRVQLYVSNIRNKNPYSNDELSSAVRNLNRIANIGVGQALGGVFQPVKQVVPVALNTLINAGNLNIGSVFNASINSFINNSGYAVANRGIESQAQVDSLNKLIDEASKSRGDVLIKKIEGLNKFWLEELLVKPDVFIARASWMSYYEQSLKKQGIDPSGIDYSTHKINKEAGNYAQRMLDRQQNISDIDLAGKLFSGKEPGKQLFIKMLMPFSSFRMNQSARLGSDLAVISDKTATVEDKKIAIRSLSGFAVEMVTFRAISAGITVLIGTVAKMAIGQEEDEEEFDKRVDNTMKGQLTSSFNDLFSPLPLLDKPVQKAGNYLTETVLEIPRESIFSIFDVPKQEYVQSLGLLGISAERGAQLYDLSKLSATGKYTDDFGKEKEISDRSREALTYMIGPAILTNIGLAPTEVNSVIRNSIRYAKQGEAKPGKSDIKKSLEKVKENNKLKDLRELKGRTKNTEELKAINKKIIEISGSDEAKEAIDAQKKALTARKERLLYDSSKGQRYNNQSDMKRLNPSLWRKRFGPNSDWDKDTRAKDAVENKLGKIETKREDKEFRKR